MTDVPQETPQADLPVVVEEVIQAADIPNIPAPIPLKSVEDIQIGRDGLLHTTTHDDTVGVINDATQELLEQAATVAQEHIAEGIKSEGDVGIVPTTEIVVTADPTAVIQTADTGSILPSDLTAEVAASAAAVAASLNHEHNDLLLSSEIAQIAAESTSDTPKETSHEQHLASRRQKDRERYASMTKDQREAYNKKRREQYHRQSEDSRTKRRERERNRYHSLSSDRAKERNARRAALERERYKKLTPAELAERNAKRRERAAALRAQKKAASQGIDLQNLHQIAGSTQVSAPAEEMDLVRVYDNANLTSDISYEALVASTQQIQPTMQPPLQPPPQDNAISNDNEEIDESVAV